MAIRQSKYIDITSGVGGRSAVKNRELIARVFTTNPMCGIGHVYEFNDLDGVMSFFGSTSNEYKYAARYFGFVAKNVSKAKKISFFRWADEESLPYIASRSQVSTDIQKYNDCDGKLTFVVGEAETEVTVDLDSVEDINEVASAIQSAVATKFAGATAHIENGRITITLNANAKDTIFACKDSELAKLLAITNGDAPVLSNYIAGETPVEAAKRSDEMTDNYGSFFFLGGIGMSDARAVAMWNKAKNFKYLYVVGRKGYTSANGGLNGDVVDWADKDTGLGGIEGTALWAYKSDDDAIEAFASALFATTDYTRVNSTKTFMYQADNTIQAAITNDATANQLDELNVNYMGVTQSAGGLIQFSQDGNNMDGVETSVYCNEVWMKASFWTAIMNLFLAVEKVPANDDGAGLIKTVMMDTITTALSNGTIQPRKELNVTQKAYIGQVTGNPDAWKTVYNDGYTLDIKIENIDNKYVAKYVLVYSKGDAIRKVEGTDILI